MPNKASVAVACDVKDLAMADVGKRRIEWAFQSMPVLQTIRKQFIKTQPLAGIRVTTASAALPPEHGYRSGCPVMLQSDSVLLCGDRHLHSDSA